MLIGKGRYLSILVFLYKNNNVQVIGHDYETFDVYEYRGDKLRDKLESYLRKGKPPLSFIPIQTILHGFVLQIKS